MFWFEKDEGGVREYGCRVSENLLSQVRKFSSGRQTSDGNYTASAGKSLFGPQIYTVHTQAPCPS